MGDLAFVSLGPASARAKLGSDMALAGEWGFVAGLDSIDLDNDKTPLPDGIEPQTQKIFDNLMKLLAAAGMTKEHVVAVRIYLVDFPKFYERMNVIYRRFFDPARLPPCTCVGVAHLTRGALVEMEFVLRKPS